MRMEFITRYRSTTIVSIHRKVDFIELLNVRGNRDFQYVDKIM